MAEQLESPAILSQALGALAIVLDGRSLLQEQLQVAQQRLAVCKDAQLGDISAGDRNVENFRERIESLRSAGAALASVGEYEQAMLPLREAENLALHAQVVDQQANAIGLQVLCNYRLDRWDEVLAGEEKWRELERRYSRERVGAT